MDTPTHPSDPAGKASADGATEIDPHLAPAPSSHHSTPTIHYTRPVVTGAPKPYTGRPASGSSQGFSGSRTVGSYGDHDGDELAERFVLRGVGPEKKPLGSGAFGEVWKAYDKVLEREVALKILQQRMCRPEVLLRFELEKQLVARMEHPNIAQVFEAGTLEDGRPFFAMELVRGLTLSDYRRERRLSVEERLHLFIPICRAVQHAHERFVLHRDLKPTNIMVVEQDGRAVPKVIDFGIAKVLEEGGFSAEAAATVEGSLKGTPAYMSPEQTQRNGELTVRSDLYTLGVILFELLAGDTPLSHQRTRELDFFQLVALICREEPVPLSIAVLRPNVEERLAHYPPHLSATSLADRLRGDLDTIVLRALQKEPARRYASAADFAADLERHLAHEPILARPPSVWYRTTKLCQRHKAAAIAAVFIFAAICGTAAVSTFSYLSVKDSLAREKLARNAAVAAKRIAQQQRALAEEARKLAVQTAQEARTARDSAVLARGESEDLLNYMLYDLRQQLEPLGRSRLLAGVSQKAEEYFARQPRLTDNDTLERNRAVMSYNRGYILLAQGDVARAVTAFRAARSGMEERLRARDDAGRQLDFATASHGLGLALRAAGQAAEARPIFEEIVPVLRPLDQQHDRKAGVLLAATLEQLGELQARAGQAEAAEALFMEQERLLRGLQSAAPDDAAISLALAVACEKVGGGWQQSGHLDKALSKFEAEVALLRKLSGDHPDDLALRRSLSVGLEKLGNVLLGLKRPEEARKLFEERMRESELLARIDPRRLEFRRDAAVAHQRLASALLELHDTAGARTHAQADLDLSGALAQEYPLDPALQGDLASSRFQMGFLLLKLGSPTPARLPEARKFLEQSAQTLRQLSADHQLDERGKSMLAELEKALTDLPQRVP